MGEKQKVFMKKLFTYAIIAFAGIALMSCNKQNNPDDPTSDNPYPYLRVSDLMPLEMISISEAETKLVKMGFNGGWQTYEMYGDQNQGYLYTSADKKDTIILNPNSERLIKEIYYIGSKGTIPSEAKSWLAHVPEKIKLSASLSEIMGVTEYTFVVGGDGSNGQEICETYSEYIGMLNNISSGMFINATWGTYPHAPGGVVITYEYRNNIDRATLVLGYYFE
jgi:hypothetical protein